MNMKHECSGCVNFVPEFSYCSKNMYIADHKCGTYKEGKPSPYKQFSSWQAENIHDLILDYHFDMDGWIKDVKVKDAPEAAPLLEIPHELVGFYYQSHSSTPWQKFEQDRRHSPGVLVMAPILQPQNPKIYKVFNGARPKTVSVINTEIDLDIANVCSLIRGFLKDSPETYSTHYIVVFRDYDSFVEWWGEKIGYPVVYYVDEAGFSQPLIAYRFRNKRVLFLVPEIGDIGSFPLETSLDTIPITDDTEILEKIKLSTRCLGCGYDCGSINLLIPCPFCQFEFSAVVWE